VKIDVAENGEIAARTFRHGKYDVVLMDVEMPVMDGYQATGEIRRFESETNAQPTSVLALTAHAFTEMKGRARDAGFTDVLTKPILKIDLLKGIVAHAPKGRRAAPERNVVEVEEGMEDVVPRYLDKRRAEIAVYLAAVDRGDFDTVRNLGHKMKGTGAGYGFPPLTEIGGVLEQAAKAGETERIRESVRRLKDYVESIDLKYSK
jgi:CheY-like chemotaxis protein